MTPHEHHVGISALIGRDQELATLLELLLAHHVALKLHGNFPGGIAAVPLAEIRDWRLVPTEIAQQVVRSHR